MHVVENEWGWSDDEGMFVINAANTSEDVAGK
jgi:hypothetical protein